MAVSIMPIAKYISLQININDRSRKMGKRETLMCIWALDFLKSEVVVDVAQAFVASSIVHHFFYPFQSSSMLLNSA
jgi:hypothetical protein